MAFVGKGHRIGSSLAPHILEVYLDFNCPYSKKAYESIVNVFMPYCESTKPDTVQFVFRHQVQNWHPQTVLVHEASLAVDRLDPSLFFPYCQALFNAGVSQFNDANTWDKSRGQIYEELADLAVATSNNKIEKSAMMQLFARDDSKGGNALTADLKKHIRLGRQNGIHVSPTALWDGIIFDFGSAWTINEWKAFLESRW